MKKILGIDVGTQGVRLVITDDKGNILDEVSREFKFDDGRIEQDPNVWWQSILDCLKNIKTRCDDLVSISVTSTSGTIIPLNSDNKPIHNALMYSDDRSSKEALEIEATMNISMKSSYSLPKMLWFKNNFHEKYKDIDKWVHATDFIIGKLTGVYKITDYTNALKSGFDVSNLAWNDVSKIGLDINNFPKVVEPGTFISFIDPNLSNYLNINNNIQIVAGLTDGCASQFASGAIGLNQWSSTIGTTLVLKGVTKKIISDKIFYSHRHPEGYYMPGGASNIGGDWISKWYRNDELDNLNSYAQEFYPSNDFIYPLLINGERFPFYNSEAKLIDNKNLNKEQKFLAGLEAVGYIEKMAFEKIEKLTGSKIEKIYVAGGSTKSKAWLQIRSSILNKQILITKNPNAAFGAVLIAASKTIYNSLSETFENMVEIKEVIKPDESSVIYQDLYKEYIDWLEVNMNRKDLII
ncbi:FGGY-family carbohydrate kinase [Mammaliicoccus sp. P-M59]|uniref:FGGY-family carbohydrate kinase n=1 Tax=Mammaliicoccus sp. P-M59 TaxID=2898718 RepID=UPI001EFBAECB|nr:FGGY-family carbohydrate kinase [Mammaliicoccus sp. P-M59]